MRLQLLVLVLFCAGCAHDYRGVDEKEDPAIVWHRLMQSIPCVQANQYSIPGLTHGDTPEAVLAAFGTPIKKAPWGGPNAETWVYKDIEVDVLVDTYVFWISTGSPKHETPSGIRPGMSRAEVLKRLGVPENRHSLFAEQQEIQVICCDTDSHLVLQFDSS